MGKVDGFLTTARAAPHRRAASLRVLDWREVEDDVPASEMREQASRCMDCGVPFCTNGCPLGNPIPDFADAVWKDRWEDAARWLATTNEFPEFTGRLCPAPCEAACVLAINDQAVAIESLERAIAERAFAEGWVVPRPPARRTGKRIAVVGAGPAGLAAAAALNRIGHTAIVFDAAAKPGGLLRYGIPDFKIEKHVVDRRIAVMEAEGVVFRCGTRVDDWAQLRGEHDAVVVAIGAERPRDLDVPGRALGGVVIAMDYLIDQNVGGGKYDVRGKHVIILGGGDTGSDCLGTAHRQGAASVRQIELMPAPPTVRGDGNPWPTWPVVFRTSSSQEEGGARDFAFRTTRLEGEAGHIARLVGRREDSGEDVTLPCETLILALGFLGPHTRELADQLGIAHDPRGNIAVDGTFATSIPGVFCAGDAHRGASLVVWAIAEGRDCAKHVDAYLRSR